MFLMRTQPKGLLPMKMFFVTKMDLDMKTCTSIVTKQENRFVDRNGHIEATKRTDDSWQCCP